jgi:hypothetical protein
MKFKREHICIRKPEFVMGNSKNPQLGFFIETRPNKIPCPYGNISSEDTVWLKWSSTVDDGLNKYIVAKATVSGYRLIKNCTPDKLHDAVHDWTFKNRQAYWKELNPNFNALIIYIDNEQWLDDPIEIHNRSYGSPWFVLDTIEKKKKWFDQHDILTTATQKDPRGDRSIKGKLRLEVMRRDNFSCKWCGKNHTEDNIKIEIDHIKPYSMGGDDSIDNLQLLCKDCNIAKSNIAL